MTDQLDNSPPGAPAGATRSRRAAGLGKAAESGAVAPHAAFVAHGDRLRVAIVGGGAAGTLAAAHLLRAAYRPLEVALIDAAGCFGPGVAYGTADPLHLLNVPACRMGGLAGQPEHFHAWLRGRGHDVAPEDFVARGLFGEYLRDLLDEAERGAGRGVSLRRLAAEVTAIEAAADDAGPLTLRLADGGSLEADQAVLAVGALPGGDPFPIPDELRDRGAYVRDPWVPGALDGIGAGETVLVVGTGLTMIDLVLSLNAGGDGPRVRAISRHGLVPRRHRRELTRVQSFPLPLEEGRLEPVVTAVIEQIGRVSLQGGDWRDVFDSVRSLTPAAWRALRVEEKRRFISTLQRYWEVHRFRMAPAVADRFEELTASGRVRVDAGSVVAVQARQEGARVSVRTVGRRELELIDVDRIVNCSGAGADVERHATPLLRQLMESGQARPDELRLGLDVAPDGGLVDAAGRASERIRVVGQLRRGVEWEAIGITEIREHAAAVAAALFASVERPLRAA